MQNKLDHLKEILQEMDRVIVAYSGGVDSTLLLKIAYDCLGERTLAITGVSPSLPAHERAEAKAIAQQIGVPHIFIERPEMDDMRYVENTPERCYFCKRIMGQELTAYAQAHGYHYIVDGTNSDDAGDHRPGQRAAREQGLRSPLQEVGLTKAEIRALAHELGLPNWDKPAAACLASRIPYGIPITKVNLAQVEQAEQALRDIGLRQLRARHHDTLLRLEVSPEDFGLILEHREDLIHRFKILGYTYITLDLEGFRSGSLNEDIASHGHT